ncbi:MAG: hypothetical protein ABW048_14480 [Sphingobium sp.]
MLTLHYIVPLSGARRLGNSLQPWTIDKIEVPPLENGAPVPDETLVKACHGAMRDPAGKRVPLDTLRAHDLREGLAAAFREIDIKPAGVTPASNTKDVG